MRKEALNKQKALDIGRAFWEKHQNGVRLKLQLIRMGIPLLDIGDDDKIGIKIAQMRYKKHKKIRKDMYKNEQKIPKQNIEDIDFSELSFSEIMALPENSEPTVQKSNAPKVKTRWLSDAGFKKGERPINMRKWTFVPISIEHQKQTTDPSDQKFVYFMQVIQTTFPADWPETQEKEEVNLSYIETRLDGSIIFNRRYQDFPQNELPHKFAFPKRYIAKINSCLLDNFWQDLRSEDTPDCFTWHRTSEGRVWYLADRGETIDQSYRDRLVDLLNSQSGDVASVLLAYTCFSILKDFFPQYHTLDKNTPYLTAKKYIRNFRSICVAQAMMQ